LSNDLLSKTKQVLTYQQNLDADLPEYPCAWVLYFKNLAVYVRRIVEE
jgi:hypothetical protein